MIVDDVLASHLGAENGRAPAAPPPEQTFIDWVAFFAKNRSEAEWLLEDVIARGRGHSIYARHGTGKSLFSLWAATRLVVEGHVVLYADYEQSEDDLYERLTDMGYGPGSDLERLKYLLLPTIRPLNTPEGAADFLALVDGVQAQWPERHVAVVIDTISRAVVGEENSNDTIIGFYRHTGIALKQRGITWTRLDHAGHEERHARGGSAKGDDVDVVWRLSTTDDGLELRADKRRMGWVPDRVSFRLITEPVLRFEKVAGAWPAGTRETALALDQLGVSATASMREAKAALQAADQGRRGAIVEAAQRYRRGLAEGRFGGVSRDSGDAGNTTPRRHPGDTPQESHNHGRETHPATPGDTPRANPGDTGASPVGGAPVSDADPVRCPRCQLRTPPGKPGDPRCRCEGNRP